MDIALHRFGGVVIFACLVFMMKCCRLFRVILVLICTAVLVDCGGRGGSRGGKRGGGSVVGETMGSDEEGSEAGGEGEFGDDAAPGEGAELSHGQTVQNLLPKDVKSADFTVIGSNGVLLLLKLTDVNQSGNIWSAKMSGEVWLPLEDMGLEREGEYLGRFTVPECEINRVLVNGACDHVDR